MNGLIKKDFYLIMKEIPVLFFVIVGAGGALANLTSPLIFIIGRVRPLRNNCRRTRRE